MQTTKITDFFGFPHVDDGNDTNDGEIELLEERLAPVRVYDPISFEDPGFSYRQSDRLVSWDLPTVDTRPPGHLTFAVPEPVKSL